MPTRWIAALVRGIIEGIAAAVEARRLRKAMERIETALANKERRDAVLDPDVGPKGGTP